ncbi:glycosyl hydrolase family 43 [Pedobacter psychrotolerans]|uniref:Arabinosidase n=1 Tax=Pedobacter psychrotolerans TaxID=1843235 RepID=A0A4R2H551_9SPHI|nr:glycoside hydrolase family 43 protein [Pedobacter psychrotolerans]TCO19895.1 glycosyl hydrolase family 43 [Pedobacter psychrotolerans]GGE49681.1 arabinosidase [Pedobacter psychrotolerans]
MFKAKYISSFRLAIIGLALCGLTSCSKQAYLFTSFHEPGTEGLRLLYSYDAYHWTDLDKTFLKPAIGTQKVMRDPSIVQGPDGTFHLVWTCSWKGDKGFGYASSKDLINWTEQKFLPVMESEAETVNVWAPEIFYDDEQKEYIVIWASTIPFRFAKGIEDENNNHRMYAITTKDFTNFSKPKLFLDPGFSVIDAVIVKRAVKDYVLVLKDNTRPNRNLKIAFGKDALGPYEYVSETFSPKLTEGPTVVKVKNDWLIYFDAYGQKIYSAYKTADFKRFKEVTSQVSIPERHKHGTIIKVKKKVIEGLKKYK